MDQQRPQVDVTPLADALKFCFAPRRVLPKHQAQPGRKLPSVLKFLGLAHRRHNGRGGKRTYAWNLQQPHALRGLLADGGEFGVVDSDLLIKFDQLGVKVR